jgi:CRISPR-associated protein (TIGR03986 family)
MEDAILNVFRSKKGKTIGEISFKNGKKMTLPNTYTFGLALNGKECQVERSKNGVIEKIFVKDNLTLSELKNTRIRINEDTPKTITDKEKVSERMAKAPYNFIPLNDQVVESDWGTWDDLPDLSKYCSETVTGTIVISLTTKTPIYIRDMKSELEEENPVAPYGESNGNIRIPGSSIRGMIRTLVEVVSYGKFLNYEDKTLYYRGLTDKSSLRQEYLRNMSIVTVAKTKFAFSAGYIEKRGERYEIIPAKKEKGMQFRKIRKRDSNEEFIYEKTNDGKYLVITGNMKNKKTENNGEEEKNKKNDWLINEPDSQATKIIIPEIDIESYKNDNTRFIDKNEKDEKKRKDGDLLRQVEIAGSNGLVPCFYLCWEDKSGNQRVSFGHTGYYRLAYKLSIADHVPEFLRKKTDRPDIAEAIFGDKNRIGSRVFFEDVFLVSDPVMSVFDTPVYTKILSAPKPTTFQHYLVQTERNDPQILKHWNSLNTNIRGYKLYWHRNTSTDSKVEYSFVEEEKKIKEAENKKNGLKQYTMIKAIKPASVFEGRIRFENLSQIELGALLFVLKLPEECCYKLGMGKPLGLGSVKIEVSVSLSDRNSVTGRYSKLFSENDWYLGNTDVGDNIEGWINKFEKYVLGIIEPSKSNGKLWDTKRMQTLKKMLDFGNIQDQTWNIRTEYMELKDFRNRKVLPEPEEV